MSGVTDRAACRDRRIAVRTGAAVEPHQVNGQPGAITRDRGGEILNTSAQNDLQAPPDAAGQVYS